MENDFYKNNDKDPRFGKYLTFDTAMQKAQDKDKKRVEVIIELPEIAKKLIRVRK